MIERPASSMLCPGRTVIVPVAPGAAAPTAVAVLITTSQPGPNRAPGKGNVTGSRLALNSSTRLASRPVFVVLPPPGRGQPDDVPQAITLGPAAEDPAGAE